MSLLPHSSADGSSRRSSFELEVHCVLAKGEICNENVVKIVVRVFSPSVDLGFVQSSWKDADGVPVGLQHKI